MMLLFLNRMSIARKLVLVFVISALVPIVLQLFFFHTRFELRMAEDIESRLKDTLDNRADSIAEVFNDVMVLARRYDQDIEFSETLNTAYTSDLDYYTRYHRIKRAIEADVPYLQQVKSIVFITENPTVFDGGYVSRMGDNSYLYEDEKLYGLEYSDDNQGTLLISATKNSGLRTWERNISLIRTMNHFTSNNDYKQMVRIDINIHYLTTMLQDIGLFDQIMLVDHENRILAASRGPALDTSFNVYRPNDIPEDSSLYEVAIDGLSIKLYGLYNQDTLVSQFYEYRRFSFVVSIICVFFAVFSMFIIARNILNRMDLVVRQSEQIAEGNFTQIHVFENDRDEFSELERSMNQMSDRLSTLIDSEFKSKIIQEQMTNATMKAQLLALQSQVNPHFLFNALESIRLKSLAKDEKETATMIKHMAKMFRNLINWEEDVITVQEEVAFLKDFLSIQQYRFEDEFSYDICLDPMALDKQIPKMIIQPIVENACIHGSSSGDALHVVIEVSQSGNALKIIVRDNGGGMTEDRLDQVRRSMNRQEYTKNVGLFNVNQRLKLFYDYRNYYFNIESQVGEGTICRLILPDIWPESS